MTCIQWEKKWLDRKSNLCTVITIPDEFWDEFKKILPREKPSETVGRPIVPYRTVLDRILYVLRTVCQWNRLHKEYGSGSTSTAHRKFLEWNRLDIFKRTWIKLLKIYDIMIGINWTWQSIESISVKSPLGG